MEVACRHIFERLGIPDAEVEVRQALAVRSLLRHSKQRLGDVDADDATQRSHARRGPNGGLSAPRREIEHPHAWQQACEVEHPLAHRSGQAGFDGVITTPDLRGGEHRSFNQRSHEHHPT